MRKRRRAAAFLMAAATLLLTACSPFETAAPKLDVSGISVNKKGMVTQVIVEDFSQSYYNADELKGQIETQIGDIGGGGEKPTVRLTDFTLSEDKNLRVEIEFDSAELYTTFNRKELFVGTVAQAVGAGYVLPQFTGPDQTPVDATAAASMGEKNIVIFEEPFTVVVPSKIIAVSENMTLTEEKKAKLSTETEGEKGYIVY